MTSGSDGGPPIIIQPGHRDNDEFRPRTRTREENLDFAVHHHVELQNDWGIGLKPGILLSEKTLGYAKFAASWARLKSDTTFSGTAPIGLLDQHQDINLDNGRNNFQNNNEFSSNNCNNNQHHSHGRNGERDCDVNGHNTQTKVGFLWGLGVERFVYRNLVSVGAEYTYVKYGPVHSRHNENEHRRVREFNNDRNQDDRDRDHDAVVVPAGDGDHGDHNDNRNQVQQRDDFVSTFRVHENSTNVRSTSLTGFVNVYFDWL